MSRNGSGTAQVPNSFSTRTTISSSAVNANFSSVASDLTNSLALDGQSTMTGQFKASTGSAATPSISFGSDTDTGFYRSSGNTIGIAAGGAVVGTIGANGITDANSYVVVGLPTGFGPVPWSASTAPTGWVRCNGRTIGNASSGATERANADTENLFTHLWNNHADSVLAVSGGRGASAAADYAANKTIALFDIRSAAVIGTDDMGNSAAGRLGTIHTTPTIIGTAAGTETVALVEANNGPHTHTGPSHTHTYSSTTGAVSTTHTHTVSGTSGAEASHAHTIAVTTATDTSTSGGGTRVTGVTQGSGVSTTAGTSHTHAISFESQTESNGHTHTVSGTTAAGGTGATGSSGSGTAHSNLQRSIVFPFILKL